MASHSVNIWESYKSEHKGRKYKDWAMALPETGGGGSLKRTSAPSEERRLHPHIQYILNECNKNLNSHPLKTPRRKKVQTVLCAGLQRCPHERPKLSIDWPAKKDVDSCQPKMRDTSSTERKRKQQQHNIDLTSPIISEDISSPHSVEEILASPSVRAFIAS
jgi:hypothetical protein